MRRDCRDHKRVRDEVGLHTAAGTLQRCQVRWAVKDRAGAKSCDLLGTCLMLQMNLEGECYGSKETKHKQHVPELQRSLQAFPSTPAAHTK